MLAFKFLAAGATSPFRRFSWPGPENGSPGAWVEAVGELELCKNGVHAVGADVLPSWLDEELWRVELDGVELERDGVLVARRGRLVERVEAWSHDLARELAGWCADRARALVGASEDPQLQGKVTTVTDMARAPKIGNVVFIAFATAEIAHALAPVGARAERARQAAWLQERLGIRPG